MRHACSLPHSDTTVTCLSNIDCYVNFVFNMDRFLKRPAPPHVSADSVSPVSSPKKPKLSAAGNFVTVEVRLEGSMAGFLRAYPVPGAFEVTLLRIGVSGEDEFGSTT